jgi:hypothetical protein
MDIVQKSNSNCDCINWCYVFQMFLETFLLRITASTTPSQDQKTTLPPPKRRQYISQSARPDSPTGSESPLVINADARRCRVICLQLRRFCFRARAVWVSLRRTRETLTIWLAYIPGRHILQRVRCGAACLHGEAVCFARSVRSCFEDSCPADGYTPHATPVVSNAKQPKDSPHRILDFIKH